ncbi:MAG: AAA family ATPase [Romboutsia sp.]
MDNHRKILVIGCPGSGKTFFSKMLSNLMNINLYHLDDLYWGHEWVEKDYKKWNEILENLLSEEEFIIDGNYLKSLKLRVQKSETIIKLQKMDSLVSVYM